MKARTAWMPLMLLAMLLGACGDGAVRSPGHKAEVFLERVFIEPDANLSTPAGTSLPLRAFAVIATTVPPGTPDVDDGVTRVTEDITQVAEWSSNATAVAEVNSGVVLGKTTGSATIQARFEGMSDTVTVAVSQAVLQGVAYVKPVGEPRSANDRYAIVEGAQANFEMFGNFSDGQQRRLSPTNFAIAWSSTQPNIANNPDAEVPNRFTGSGAGSTAIVGQVLDNPGINPSSAAATLDVSPLSQVCVSELFAPEAVVVPGASIFCLGCDVTQPAALVDGNTQTFATMNIPLGLLFAASVSVTVSNANAAQFAVGQPAAFLVSRSSGLLSLELLSLVSVATVQCDVNGENCNELERFGAGNSLPLKLSLLGVIGGEQVRTLSTPPLGAASAGANGLRLGFSGGLLSAAAELNVHTACAIAQASDD